MAEALLPCTWLTVLQGCLELYDEIWYICNNVKWLCDISVQFYPIMVCGSWFSGPSHVHLANKNQHPNKYNVQMLPSCLPTRIPQQLPTLLCTKALQSACRGAPLRPPCGTASGPASHPNLRARVEAPATVSSSSSENKTKRIVWCFWLAVICCFALACIESKPSTLQS